MIKKLYCILLFILPNILFGQTTKIYGHVKDEQTGENMPYVKIQFYNSKIGTLSDSLGNYSIETYYATDSLQFSFFGYETKTIKVKKDEIQEINCSLTIKITQTEEVVIRPPDELPSTALHKKVIANKNINNKEKLLSYEYEWLLIIVMDSGYHHNMIVVLIIIHRIHSF